MSPTDSKIQKVQTHFQALSSIASSLNAASDELTKVVGVLDEALKKLNVGLPVWVTAWSRGVEDWEFDDDQIGYYKVNGKWGVALRHIWGDHRDDTFYDEGPWLFNDAPRELRLRCVNKIPEVIEALAKEAFNTTKKIQDKTKEVRELAEAIGSVTNEAKGKSLTLAERIAAGQKELTDSGKSFAALQQALAGTGKLSDLAHAKEGSK